MTLRRGNLAWNQTLGIRTHVKQISRQFCSQKCCGIDFCNRWQSCQYFPKISFYTLFTKGDKIILYNFYSFSFLWHLMFVCLVYLFQTFVCLSCLHFPKSVLSDRLIWSECKYCHLSTDSSCYLLIHTLLSIETLRGREEYVERSVFVNQKQITATLKKPHCETF